MTLAIKLKKNNNLNGEVFNFGPKKNNKRNVLSIVKTLKKDWKKAKWKILKRKKFKGQNYYN